MVAPLDRPIVCPTTIGRAPHLAAVDRLLDQLAAGRGQTLLVTGEAGIGKSRLVSETRARAIDRGMLALQGQCFETDRSLPYAPFVDLLRGSEQVGQHDVQVLLPELVESSAPTDPLADPEVQKRRLFNAVTDFVAAMARERQVLLIVEDVHWADETSLELLRSLARMTSQRAVLMVLTYRADELDDNLRALLAALDRERLSVELRLQRLSREELEAMLRAIFQQAWPGRTDFLDLLFGLTDGNPFFVEE